MNKEWKNKKIIVRLVYKKEEQQVKKDENNELIQVVRRIDKDEQETTKSENKELIVVAHGVDNEEKKSEEVTDSPIEYCQQAYSMQPTQVQAEYPMQPPQVQPVYPMQPPQVQPVYPIPSQQSQPVYATPYCQSGDGYANNYDQPMVVGQNQYRKYKSNSDTYSQKVKTVWKLEERFSILGELDWFMVRYVEVINKKGKRTELEAIRLTAARIKDVTKIIYLETNGHEMKTVIRIARYDDKYSVDYRENELYTDGFAKDLMKKLAFTFPVEKISKSDISSILATYIEDKMRRGKVVMIPYYMGANICDGKLAYNTWQNRADERLKTCLRFNYHPNDQINQSKDVIQEFLKYGECFLKDQWILLSLFFHQALLFSLYSGKSMRPMILKIDAQGKMYQIIYDLFAWAKDIPIDVTSAKFLEEIKIRRDVPILLTIADGINTSHSRNNIGKLKSLLDGPSNCRPQGDVIFLNKNMCGTINSDYAYRMQVDSCDEINTRTSNYNKYVVENYLSLWADWVAANSDTIKKNIMNNTDTLSDENKLLFTLKLVEQFYCEMGYESELKQDEINEIVQAFFEYETQYTSSTYVEEDFIKLIRKSLDSGTMHILSETTPKGSFINGNSFPKEKCLLVDEASECCYMSKSTFRDMVKTMSRIEEESTVIEALEEREVFLSRRVLTNNVELKRSLTSGKKKERILVVELNWKKIAEYKEKEKGLM